MERFASSDLASRAEALLGPVIEDVGFRLLLCDWTGAGGRPVLWVYIERPDGEHVDIGDCVKVNDAITDLLDAEDLVPIAYDLRVSSPGVDRPLKRVEHFLAQVGKVAKIKSWEPIGGRRNWKGTLLGVDEDLVLIEVDGGEHRIPIPAIERANLVWVPPAKGQKKGGSTRKKRGRK
jgi:ribosome maturation factor RimP